MTSAPAIGFDYSPSRLLPRCLLLVATLAAIAVLVSALPAWLRAVTVVALALATWQACHRLRSTVVAAAGWSAESGWTLHTVDGEDHPASLASFRVLGDLVWLRMHSAQQGISVLLLAPDNSDADIRRRLRMRLATLQPGEALPRW
ncbi:MAG: protein YgfX [Rhodanobacter lindaniclasticus]